jgi:hypothetical protein
MLSAALVDAERGLVVDLSSVTYMGRSGVVEMLRLRAGAPPFGIEPVFAAPSSAVRRLFEALTLDRLFRTADTWSQAVELALLIATASARQPEPPAARHVRGRSGSDPDRECRPRPQGAG